MNVLRWWLRLFPWVLVRRQDYRRMQGRLLAADERVYMLRDQLRALAQNERERS